MRSVSIFSPEQKDKTLVFMDMLADLRGTYAPFREFDERKKEHTSGRREDRREPVFVHVISRGSAISEINELNSMEDRADSAFKTRQPSPVDVDLFLDAAAKRSELQRTYYRDSRGCLRRVLAK